MLMSQRTSEIIKFLEDRWRWRMKLKRNTGYMIERRSIRREQQSSRFYANLTPTGRLDARGGA